MVIQDTFEGVQTDDQARLAMALVAPIGQRPVVAFVSSPELQREHDAMTVQQCQMAERGMVIERVHHEQVSGKFESRMLAAKREKVRNVLVFSLAIFPLPH